MICTPSGSVTPRRRAKSLGGGGSGTVYPCLYGQHKQKRAVKFLTANKLDERRLGRQQADFEASFENERAVLSQLSHSNISIFHEDGVYVDDKGAITHFLVTDLVSGPMLEEALQSDALDGEAIYEILGDLLDAVAYLHQRGVYHCDIKLANIAMRGSLGEAYDVVLLDWGATQVFPAKLDIARQSTLDISVDPSTDRIFVSTDDVTHDRHKHYLKIGPVSVQELSDIVPSHELHTLGVLIEEITDPNTSWSRDVRFRLSRAIGDRGMRVLDEMVRDLKVAPEGKGYSDVGELVGEFRKLHRNYLAPAGVPELGLASEFHSSVLTAAGRTVKTKRLSRLTDHRLVNRLHQVQQLESTYLTYPGATHTRYSHSLAVLRQARYYLSHLLNDSRFRRQAERPDLEAALLLALLHDIGHYQLSHMFEDLASDQASGRNAEQWRRLELDIPTDDTIFQAVLGSPSGDETLRGGYRTRIHSRAEELHTASAETSGSGPYVSPWEIIGAEFGADTATALVRMHDLIYAKHKPSDTTPAQRVLAAVLSSDIDADKTAYLLEDSQRTGVAYGLGVDVDGILSNLCMPTEEDLERSGPNPVVGIRRAGVQAAQSVAVNRNQMLSRVYWHYNNRSITAMVKHALMRLQLDTRLDIGQYVELAMFASREACVQHISDQFRQVKQNGEVDPVAGVLAGGRELYVRVCEVRDGLVDEAVELNDRLVSRSYHETLVMEDALIEELSRLPALRGMSRGELLLDIPSKEREKPSGERGGKVFVYDRTQDAGAGTPLEKASPLYPGLKDQHKQVNRVSRVFLAPRWAEEIQEPSDQTEVAMRLVRHLRAEVGM